MRFHQANQVWIVHRQASPRLTLKQFDARRLVSPIRPQEFYCAGLISFKIPRREDLSDRSAAQRLKEIVTEGHCPW